MLPDVPRAIHTDAALRDLAHPDPRVRAAAAGALDRAEPERREEVCEALRNALDDGRGEVRYAAALSLRHLGDREAVPRLIDMLWDQDGFARQAAAMALGRLGDPQAVEPLITALRDGPPDLRFQAIPSLTELQDRRAVAPITEALADHDVEVRANAAAALGDLDAREAADGLVPLLQDPVETIRFEAAYALSRLDDPRGRPALEAMSTHREFGPMACAALGVLGDRAALGALRRALKRSWWRPQLRVEAAAALVRLGEQAPRDALVRLSRSRRPDVRGLALTRLGELDGAWALEALLAGLRGKSPDAAARALGERGDPSAVPGLRTALQRVGRDEELRQDIEQAIARLSGSRAP
jgi:HEAT repeat protein